MATIRTPGCRVEGQGAAPAPNTRQRASQPPTLADFGALWRGRDRLLRVAEVAEHLGVCNATVYRLCDTGELPHVWIVTRSGSDPRTFRRSWTDGREVESAGGP